MAYYGSKQYAEEMAKKAQAVAQSAKGALSTVGNINKVAAWRANQVSKQAQLDQYAMNLQMMREANALQASMFAKSMDFNAQQTDLAWQRSQQNWNQTANYNAQQNAIAQQYNSAEAEKQRQWQEYMSNTSYQRAMEDMRKAGLNPILAYMQGGASTPVGSSGSISGASMSNLSANAGSVGSGSAHAGSVSSFSGAMENTSNVLATVGAISELIEYLTSDSGDGEQTVIGKAVSDAKSFYNNQAESVLEDVQKIIDRIRSHKNVSSGRWHGGHHIGHFRDYSAKPTGIGPNF